MKYPEEMYIDSRIFAGDMDGSESNLTEKIVKIRYPHSCCICESGTCYLCMKLHNDYRRHPVLQEHHIFGGCPNRTHSGHYGLKVYLCNVHHLAGTGPEAAGKSL